MLSAQLVYSIGLHCLIADYNKNRAVSCNHQLACGIALHCLTVTIGHNKNQPISYDQRSQGVTWD